MDIGISVSLFDLTDPSGPESVTFTMAYVGHKMVETAGHSCFSS